jgi:hypothetical protein
VTSTVLYGKCKAGPILVGCIRAQLIVPHVTLAQKMLPGPRDVLERCIGLPDPLAQQCSRFRMFDKKFLGTTNVQFQFRGFDDTREYRNFFKGPGSIGTVFRDLSRPTDMTV